MSNTPIRGFSLDFNWDGFKRPASPGLYAQADPRDQLRWMQELGANTIQTYCVSYPGLAWFKSSRTAPVNPGLKHDFLPELVELGQAAGMKVLGYFCFGSNPIYEYAHPDEISVGAPHRNLQPILATERYLDYFCAQIAEALAACPMDGFMIDWLITPQWRDEVNACEKQLWAEMMGEPYPSAKPDDRALWAFDRALLERAWKRIRSTIDSVRPATIIWPNGPSVNGPRAEAIYAGGSILAECDWLLNEFPELDHIDATRSHMKPEAIFIQDVCGSSRHDADKLWDTVEKVGGHSYGYATIDPSTCLPHTSEPRYWTARKLATVRADMQNIEKIRRQWNKR